MTFLLTLLVVIVLTFLLRTPIKRAPWLFYILAVLTAALFMARDVVQLPAFIDRPFFLLMQKCTIAEALFVVVMAMGVFDVKSKVRSWLQPIRAELSIIGCILALGHVVAYLGTFGASILFRGTAYNGFLLTSLCISLVLFALLLVLGITSFEFLKRRMKTKSWVRVQHLAYAFYALTYAHILLCLLPPALGGGASAQISVLVYSIVFAAYAVLRIRRWAVDRALAQRVSREKAALAG